MNTILSNFQKLPKRKQHVHHVHHSSRARGTVLFLQTSLPLTKNMNVKVTVELYYVFSKISKFAADTGNFSLTLPLLSKSEISRLYPSSVVVCVRAEAILKTDFFMTRLIWY